MSCPIYREDAWFLCLGVFMIRSASGELVESVGISGDTPGNDEICAIYGTKAAGLVPDTGDKE